jgi:hypothetical protein
MSNIRQFRRHDDHDDDPQPGSLTAPDNAKLQKLLGDLVEATSAKPKVVREQEVRIRNFRSERLTLADDLIIMLEEHDGHYLANSYDTGQYGYGLCPDDAIQHLCSVLEDYYDLLLEDEGRLSPHLASHLLYLKAILKDR